jgi:cell division septum initiation protein DivIVA
LAKYAKEAMDLVEKDLISDLEENLDLRRKIRELEVLVKAKGDRVKALERRVDELEEENRKLRSSGVSERLVWVGGRSA